MSNFGSFEGDRFNYIKIVYVFAVGDELGIFKICWMVFVKHVFLVCVVSFSRLDILIMS